MSENPIILSIIIPVYKVEDYVADTLRSCLDQDIPHESYEILCIDDGSPDRSAEIIAEMAAEHPNIRLIRRENHGVSATRNFGLAEARGEYVWFVDSDDLITPHCLGTLVDIMEREEIDYLQFQIDHFTDTPPAIEVHPNYAVCDDPLQIHAFLSDKGSGSACRNLYRRSRLLALDIRFHAEISYSEDVLFCHRAMIVSRRVADYPTCCYLYRQRPGSAMHSNNIEKHARSMRRLADAYQEIAETCPEHWRAISIHKRHQAIKALLFSTMMLGSVPHARQVLEDVHQAGYYPYPIDHHPFRECQTRKQRLINGISLLFPKKWYFLTCVRLYGLLKGKKI